MVPDHDDAMNGNEGGTSSGKAKKKSPIMMIVIVVIVLAVIGVVSVFVILPMLSGGGEGEEEAAEEVPVTATEVVLPQGQGVYDPTATPGIIEFPDSIMIRLRKPEGVLATDSYLRLGISFEVVSPEVQALMEADPVVMSRIRSTIIEFFSQQYPQAVEVNRWPKLKEDLMTEINAYFPEEYHVTRVNFGDFLVQAGR